MATDKLNTILHFTGVGGTATLPHGLILAQVPIKPDLVFLQFQDSFELVSATTTDLTIRNTANPTGDCDAYVYAIHPAIRLLGLQPDDGLMTQGMTPRPFCPGSPNGPAGAGGPTYVVVFRPGGVAAENVVTAWPDALARLALLQGTRVLEFDDSIVSPIVIPVPAAPGAYDMTSVIWASIPDRTVEVHVPEGVTFTHLRAFEGTLNVTFTGATPPVADFGPPLFDAVTMNDGATVRSTGTGAFFSATANAVFILGDNSLLLTGTHPVLDIPAAVVVTAFVQGANAAVTVSSISGIVGSTFNLITADSAIVVASETQAAFLGTFNITNSTKDRTFPTAVLVANTVLAVTSQLVRVDPTGGAFAVTLPAAAENRGTSITFKNVSHSVNNVTITAAGGNTVEGGATLVLSGDQFFCRVTSDGVSAWWVTSA